MNRCATRIRPAKPLASLVLLATLLSISAACTEQRQQHDTVQIRFESTWKQSPIDCNSQHIALSDLRFYVSDVVLLDASGAEHKLTMSEDNQWQQSNVALLDLENGEGACNNGTAQLNTSISGTADKLEIVGIRFIVGVPFELNHANPLLAKAPLNGNAMHWHWRSGYKFLRAGVMTKKDGFWVHLGSTACEGSVRNILNCQNPNRVMVEINEFSPATDTIAVDISAMFAGVNFSDEVPDDCSSSPAEPMCAPVFASLGLAFSEHSAREQTVFRVSD